MTKLDSDLLARQRPIRAGAVRSAGRRVVVLYEPGRSGSAALDLARRLVAGDGSALTVVTVAPQDTRICCGAGSALDYNRAVCEAADAELREACEVLGRAGERVWFKLLVQDKDPPLADWIAAGGFDVVLLPARRRPLRRSKHPAADQLRRSTCAAVCVVDAGSSSREAVVGIPTSAEPTGRTLRKDQMTKRADFNAEEWTTVVDGPIYAALRVIAASHGGRLRESLALARAYQDSRSRHGENELLDELVKSPPAIDADEVRHAQSNIVEVATQQLRDAAATVGAKATPAETDAYKTFVMTVAQAVASAHKEGGFLGIGGKQITDAENQALDDISSALGPPPAA